MGDSLMIGVDISLDGLEGDCLVGELLVAAKESKGEGWSEGTLTFLFLAVSLFFSDNVHLDDQLQRGEEVVVQVQGEVDVHLHEQQLQMKGVRKVFVLHLH